MTTQPTTATIETAMRNADKAERSGYRLEEGVRKSLAYRTWAIFKPGDKTFAPSYVVTIPTGTAAPVCDCPQCAREGYCKHIEMVRREEAIRDAEGGFENRFDCLAGKF